MMYVRLIKKIDRLSVGECYRVESLWNDGTNPSWREGTIKIRGSRYNVKFFELDGGGKIPNINIVISLLYYADVSPGDILECITKQFKTLKEGSLYRISEKRDKNLYTQSGVRFDGIRYWFTIPEYGTRLFRKLSKEEVRMINLSHIIKGTPPLNITKIKKDGN